MRSTPPADSRDPPKQLESPETRKSSRNQFQTIHKSTRVLGWCGRCCGPDGDLVVTCYLLRQSRQVFRLKGPSHQIRFCLKEGFSEYDDRGWLQKFKSHFSFLTKVLPSVLAKWLAECSPHPLFSQILVRVARQEGIFLHSAKKKLFLYRAEKKEGGKPCQYVLAFICYICKTLHYLSA